MNKEKLKKVIGSFVNQPLYQACCDLLHCLGIAFTEVTAKEIPFEQLYQSPLPKYLREIMDKVSVTYYIGNLDDNTLSGKSAGRTISDVKQLTSEGKYASMMVFAVEVMEDVAFTRSENASLTRAFNHIASQQPVILFVRQGHQLSISTCERMKYVQEWRSGEKLGKVCLLRNIDCAKPHRGHIDILSEIGDKRCTSFDELYQHWMKVFSSDELTRSFYTELQNWYFWAVLNVVFPNDTQDPSHDEEDNNKNVIRLITRLIFVWFLMHKGLVNQQLFDVKALKNILKDFDPEGDEGNYYIAILQNLFFATLNQEIPNRKFVPADYLAKDVHDIKTYYRNPQLFKNSSTDQIMELFNQTPFVNGGLFECLDYTDESGHRYCYDGFSNNKTLHGHSNQALVPNFLFFGKDREADLRQAYGQNKYSKVRVNGIIRILDRYNFTIEENTPLDEDVALDPELLGKVFENLLGAYNPETQTTARKNTGSYYTPRPIVDYMVKESLKAYLVTSCKDIPEQDIDSLLNYEDLTLPEDLTEAQVKEILKSIYHCKILDPACGSGAFPMGCLQQMVHVISKLDQDNSYWEDLVTTEALEDASRIGEVSKEEKEKYLKEIHEVFNQKNRYPNYGRKLYLIERCIFGVDIQEIAVQISRLRCFISLLVDQKPNKDPNKNYGILKLPNLESNFVAANTLIPIKLNEEERMALNDNAILPLIEQLKENRHLLFMPKNNNEKLRLRAKDKKLRQQISEAVEKVYKKNIDQKVKDLENNIRNNEKKLNELGNQFDDSKCVTVENIDLFGNKSVEKQKQNNPRLEYKKYIKNARRQISALRDKSQLSQILASIKKLTDWDMFNQNTSSPFFDPQWMFGVKDGFDVVIGNPPYISAPSQVKNKDLKEQRKTIVKSHKFVTLNEKWDLFIPFIERGIQANKEGGICTMIVPYPLTNQKYGLKLRRWICENFNLAEIVDLNGTKVFENVTVSNCIPLIIKEHPTHQHWIAHIEERRNIHNDYIIDDDTLIQDKKKYVWNLGTVKHKSNLYPDFNVLGDYCYISVGMVLNADEKTAKGEFKKEDLISDIPDNIHPRKYIEAKDIKKYHVVRQRYLEYNTDRCPDKLRRPTFRELYNCRKLVMNCLGTINCTLDNDEHYLHNHSIYCAIPWNELASVKNKSITNSIKKFASKSRAEMEKLSINIDLSFLCGIMNSKYAAYLLQGLRGGDYHIYPEHIRNIPIPPANQQQQKKVATVVNNIVSTLNLNPQSDISSMKREIDDMVYALYGLTYEEVKQFDSNFNLMKDEYEHLFKK